MTHYANYRAQIRRMSDESSFPNPTVSSNDAPQDVQPAELKPFYPAPPQFDGDIEVDKKSSGPNPYKEYLRRRRKVVFIQIVVFIILVAVFATWMFFLKQRS